MFGVKGSSFSFSENSVFYSIADFGARKTKTAAENDVIILSTLTQLASKGGGVLLIPHGFANTFTQSSFPATVTPLAVWILTGTNFKILTNTVSAQEFGPYTKIGGQILGKVEIVTPATGTSVQISDDTQNYIINNPSTLAALTVTLPQNPQDGNEITIFALNPVTTFTLSAGAGEGIASGHTITTLEIKQTVKYVYHLATNSWYMLETNTLGFSYLVSFAAGLTASNPVTVAGQVVGKRSIQNPATGTTVQIADDTQYLILDLAATIAALTIILPQNPQDGNIITIWARNAVTALTLNAGTGETIATGHTLAAAALTAGASYAYIYNAATTSWFRFK